MKSQGKPHNRRYRHAALPGDIWLIPGDLHFPICDWDAVVAMMRWFEREELIAAIHFEGGRSGVILQGDTIDSNTVSRHPKNADRLAEFPRLLDEAKTSRGFLEWAGRTHYGCLYIKGNHEDWLTDLQMREPGLAGAPGFKLENLVGLNDIPNVEWLDYGSWVVLGDKVQVCHGSATGFPKKPSGCRMKYPNQFTIYGHTHKSGLDLWTVYEADGSPRTMGAMNVGHMSEVPEYAEDPDWQRSFGVVKFFGDRGDGQPFFSAELKHIVRDKNGKCYVA